MTTKQNFNGGYIKAIKNKYKISDMLGNLCINADPTFNFNAAYWYIENNILKNANIEYILHNKFKQFYINNGNLSWDEPKTVDILSQEIYKLLDIDEPIQINSMEDLNELPIVGEEDENIACLSQQELLEEAIAEELYANPHCVEIISITDEDGKVYEFEKPEFECELWKIVPESNTTHWDGRYNLTPIKPKWYEDKDNFPALVKFEHSKVFDTVDYYKPKENEIWNHQGGYYKPNEIRLATKQECDRLYCEGK